MARRAEARDDGSARPLGLADMPYELILEILSHIASPLHVWQEQSDSWTSGPDTHPSVEHLLEARRALHSSSLTSRSWAEAARGFLYRDVLLNTTAQLYLLLRSLATLPNLRPLVGGLIWMGKLDGVEGLGDARGGERTRMLDELDRRVFEAQNALFGAAGGADDLVICAALGWEKWGWSLAASSDEDEEFVPARRKYRRAKKVEAKARATVKTKFKKARPNQTPRFVHIKSDKTWHVDGLVAVVHLTKNIKHLSLLTGVASESGVVDYPKTAAYHLLLDLPFLAGLETLVLDAGSEYKSEAHIGEMLLERMAGRGYEFNSPGAFEPARPPIKSHPPPALRRVTLQGRVYIGRLENLVLSNVTELIFRCDATASLPILQEYFPALKKLVWEIRKTPAWDDDSDSDDSDDDEKPDPVWPHLTSLTIVTSPHFRSRVLQMRESRGYHLPLWRDSTGQPAPRMPSLEELTVDCSSLLGAAWDTTYAGRYSPAYVVSMLPPTLRRFCLINDDRTGRPHPSPGVYHLPVAQKLQSGHSPVEFVDAVVELLLPECEGVVTVRGPPPAPA